MASAEVLDNVTLMRLLAFKQLHMQRAELRLHRLTPDDICVIRKQLRRERRRERRRQLRRELRRELRKERRRKSKKWPRLARRARPPRRWYSDDSSDDAPETLQTRGKLGSESPAFFRPESPDTGGGSDELAQMMPTSSGDAEMADERGEAASSSAQHDSLDDAPETLPTRGKLGCEGPAFFGPESPYAGSGSDELAQTMPTVSGDAEMAEKRVETASSSAQPYVTPGTKRTRKLVQS